MKGKIGLTVILALLPLSAIFADPTIVGTWQELKELQDYPGSHASIIFGEDGTFVYNGPGAYRCRYKVSGKFISITGCDYAPDEIQKVRIVALNARALVLQWPGANQSISYHRTEENTAEPPAPTVTGVGRHVQVLWQGSWYAATIVQVQGNTYLVHYDGYDSSSDEWITADRIKADE